MARPVTLASMRQEVRWHCDLEQATLRLTDSELDNRINLSIAKYRSLVTTNGSPVYVSAYETNIPNSATLNESGRRMGYSEIDISALPDGVENVLGIDLSVNDVTYEIESTSFSQRNRFLKSGNALGVPDRWIMRDNNTIMLLPACQGKHPLTIWYLPEFKPLVNDDDVFDTIITKGQEWILWDVVEDIAIRENYPKLERSAASNRASDEAEILFQMADRFEDNPKRRTNTRARRLNRSRYQRFSSRYGS
jgi:hypothetical protein